MRRSVIRTFGWTVVLMFMGSAAPSSENVKSERHRAEQILNLVSRDVQSNFYDATLKGLDWHAAVDEARQRIQSAQHLGDMFGAISALVYHLHDSHTTFIPPQRKLKARYGFRAMPVGDKILVYRVDKEGPAAKAGLQPGDQILGVQNLNAVRDNFPEMMRYLTMIDPRTELDIEVADQGSNRMVKIPATLTPQEPEYFFRSLEKGAEDETPERPYDFKDYSDGVRYVRLRTFLLRSTDMVGLTKPLKDARAIILDLRRNGGGMQDFLTDLSGQFVAAPFELGKSISRGKESPLRVVPLTPHILCPLFLLVDSGSASASEMFARSMQIHKRAVLIGDRTSGRVNSAQFFWEPVGSWQNVEFGTEVSVAKVVMEDGQELEGRGVTPDEFCIPTPNDIRTERDPCLERALMMARAAKN